jgi:hypothetical protein
LVILLGVASVQAQPSYSFLPEVRVNQDAPGVGVHMTGFPNGHSIGLSDGNPVIVWYGGASLTDRHIFISRSTDGGATFLAPLKLDSAPMIKGLYPTLLCTEGGYIYVCWQDSIPGAWHLYLTRSTDGGQTFGPRVQVDSNGGWGPQLPSLAWGYDVLYCTWVGYPNPAPSYYSSVYLARSTDHGLSFGPSIDVDSTIERPVHASYPSIGSDFWGYIHLAWRDDRVDTVNHYPYHIYSVKSSDGGNSFSAAVRVDVPGEASGTFPSLAVDRTGQNVWVAHKERSMTEGYGIFVGRSTDGGASFSTTGRLDSISDSDVPGLALSEPDRLFMTWYDTRNGGNIYFANSTDGGVTFSQGQRVNSDFDSVGDWSPGIAVGSGDTVSVCWTDARHGGTTPDVCFARGIPIPGGIADEAKSKTRLQLQVRATPSPARDVVRFTLLARRPASITLEVSDACGRIVKQFRDIEVSSGLPRYVEWNARDARSKVPAGIYFYRWYAGSGGSPSAGQTGRFCLVQSH